MNILSLPREGAAAGIASLLQLRPDGGPAVDVGIATFPRDIRYPETGYSAHEQHEVSLVLSGEITLETKSGLHVAKTGGVIHMAPGEQHAVIAKCHAQVFYVLLGAAPSGT